MNMRKVNQIKNDFKKKRLGTDKVLCYCYTCKTTVINLQIIA